MHFVHPKKASYALIYVYEAIFGEYFANVSPQEAPVMRRSRRGPFAKYETERVEMCSQLNAQTQENPT